MNRLGIVALLVLYAGGSIAFALRLWSWVLNFDPGFTFSHQPIPTGLPVSRGVTVLLIDGLRLDASRGMPALNALRRRGADIEAEVGTPSFSRPGRATLAVGAFPAIHGVTTNRQKRALTIDNLLRRVGALGGTCRVAGSKIWPGLFGDDISRCGVYRAGEAKEGSGAFVRQAPEVRAADEAGVAFVLEPPATLRIADIISTDFAAHEYGGTSKEYLAEVLRADQVLARLQSRLDLSKETLVVTSDHGHRDAGGHGGEEPEVLAIPVVMAGAGIRPSTRANASQADIAPTIAVLLGAAFPAAASGRPIASVLLVDETKRAVVEAASAAQKSEFDRAVGRRLGVEANRNGSTDWRDLTFVHRTEEKDQRDVVFIFVNIALLSSVFMAAHFARSGALGPLTGLLAAIALLVWPIRARMPAMSFSAINYDEMLVPFFAWIMEVSALTTLLSIVAAVLASRLMKRGEGEASPAAVAGTSGLNISSVLVLLALGWWWRQDLLSPATLPGPDRMVEAFALTLSAASASITSLALLALFWAAEGVMARRAEARSNSRGSPTE